MGKGQAVLSLAASIGIPLIGGFAGSLLTIPEIPTWYKSLKKPKWNPPNWLFGPAWGVLYTAQGVASWLVWRRRNTTKVVVPLTLYGIQLLLNWAWTPIFFKAHRPDIATGEAAAMLGVATAATVTMARAASPEQILPLMVPYLGWIAFATALSAKIHQLNPEAHKSAKDKVKDAAADVKSAATKAVPGVKGA
eukprot:CAMPEP_0202899828 /NCGR_PEP_ID=MMETSP1392-20130828/8745_1 /ASSEMBLY_ACC=CAM_ASM_000868 /TAXON_ID=225041 /ORGANISM="Chlamydomonas chlamydogama, Strain SAG 11-48b" /LENGTH=192 /DNA_ID=CAMNT_0049586103 /DNA_START=60 /DNA_END=638 /DNA_ORIENTATION=+